MTYETRCLLAEADEDTREDFDEDMNFCRGCDWPVGLCAGASGDCGGRWCADGPYVG